MSRIAIAALSASLVASACKVAPTPQEYIDHREPIATVREGAAEELRDRLLAMGQALNRADVAEALQALAPRPDAYLVAADGREVVTGEAGIGGALAALGAGEDAMQLSDVRVTVGPRANVAWFRALLEPGGEGPGPVPHRLTGVYLRGDEGEWRLVQAHLSPAGVATDPLPADSLPPSPASAEALPGAG